MKDVLIVDGGLPEVRSAVGTMLLGSTDASLAMAGHPDDSAYAQEAS
ncbi:hypothetical protein [Mycolicibacterium grossiae]|nr:hypothetical protein [Mycolicibacterium grossiae]